MSKSASDQRELFGELRSVLQRGYAPQRWRELWQLTQRWPDDAVTREQLVPYALDHISGWPDAARVAPGYWGDMALRGQAPPALALARTLNLPGRELSLAQARRLGGCEELAALRALDLSESELGAGALGALLDGGALGELRALTLFKCGLTRADASALAAWPGLTQLELLDLRDNPALPLTPIFSAPQLGVARLELGQQQLDQGAAAALAQNEGAARLKALGLSSVTAEAGALRELAQSAYLGQLEVLRLHLTPFHPEEVVELMERAELGALRELEIVASPHALEQRHVRRLAESPALASLRTLVLPQLDEQSALTLAASSMLSDPLRQHFSQMAQEIEAERLYAMSPDYEDDWE